MENGTITKEWRNRKCIMEKYFTENTTFFVEVPAIENPEFAKALTDMVETGKRQRPVPELKDLPENEPEEDLDEEPEKKSVDVEEHADPGKACPPPAEAGRQDGRKRGRSSGGQYR